MQRQGRVGLHQCFPAPLYYLFPNGTYTLNVKLNFKSKELIPQFNINQNRYNCQSELLNVRETDKT